MEGVCFAAYLLVVLNILILNQWFLTNKLMNVI